MNGNGKKISDRNGGEPRQELFENPDRGKIDAEDKKSHETKLGEGANHTAGTFTGRMNWILACVVACLTICVFSGTFRADFVHWDDDVNIYENPHLRDGITAQSLKWMFTDMSYIPRYMPLGWLSYAASCELTGLNPSSHHGGNILFHALNSVLIYFLLQRLLTLGGAKGGKPGHPWVMAGAACGALLWAVHPLRSEVVACASARIYGQALFFLLISLWSYLRAQEVTGWARMIWLCGSVGAFLVSLLTYPLALGFVAVLLLIDFFPLRRLAFSRKSLFGKTARRVWLEKIPFVGATVLVLGVTLWARTNSGQWAAPVSLAEFGILERAMQSFYIWAYYLWKPLWPTNLAPTYTTLLSFNPWNLKFLLSAALVIGLSIFVLRHARRWPAVTVLWLCHLALLVPFLGLTEHPHYAYDRYSYIVGILWSVLAAWAMAKFWGEHRRRIAFNTCGLVVIVFSFLAFQQATRWQNTPTLLKYIIAQVGEHPIAGKQQLVLGHEYLSYGQNEKAEAHLRHAIELLPDSADAHAALAEALANQDRFSEAIPVYQHALRLNPTHKTASQNFGVALGSTGRFSEAADQFRVAIRVNATNATAHHNLALTLAKLGQRDEAKLAFAEAQRLRGESPKNSAAHEH
jgi:Tfp pilus assembly protein PilF